MFGIIGSIVSAVSGAVSAIGSGIANLASGIASFAVSVILNMIVREKIKDIGILKSIGYTNRNISMARSQFIYRKFSKSFYARGRST